MSKNFSAKYFFFSAKYYQENKERLQKKACERYKDFSKEENEKKVAIWS